jgi:hypothetical protein
MIDRWAGVAVIVAVVALMWALLDRPTWIKARRWDRGQCVRCGYDLTGNVSGVCPECGRWKGHPTEISLPATLK